ncbi:ABC transporter permease [Lactiplantibacillus fabifermentans]|uniref:ABC transporter permease n=2 Tax=Lactiplantibacillus fabifermentans TaxID=483011 RepID=A0A0R2NNS2_9LACO|nr:ABC transporter permease [Lactiplantibacillus fabifermentans]ETY73993.1 ABC transporter permease [Lactiplantibacillus fabifermentans T30PCM01]KRO27351.1 ABC transporter permease [Lactiplantibacillus fabifermentans DSM 21115]
MQASLWLIRERIIMWKNHPWQVLFLLAIPFLSVGLYLYTSTSTTQNTLTVGVVDHDDSAASRLLATNLRRRVTVQTLTTKKTQQQALVQQSVTAIVTIPAGYQRQITNGQHPAVTVASIQHGALLTTVKNMVKAAAVNVLQLQAMTNKTADLQQVGQTLQQQTPTLKIKQIDQQASAHTLTIQIIGFLLMMLLYQANTFGTRSLQRERRNQTYQRTMLAPLSPANYFIGTAGFAMLAMVVEIGLAITVMVGVFKIDVGMGILPLFAVLCWFGLLAVLWSLAIGVLAPSTGMANGIQVLLITVTSLLSGCLIQLSVMPAVMQKVAMVTPQYWILQALQQLQNGTITSRFWGQLAMVGLFGLLFFSLAVFGFMRRQHQEIFD